MNASYRKPRANIYTALLALALAASIIATIFAYLETNEYGDKKYRGAPRVPTVTQAASFESTSGLSVDSAPTTRVLL